MLKLITALLFSFMLIMPAHADDLSAADKQAVQQVISSQLDAFKSENGPLAYSFAAPVVTTLFPTVEVFMGMVKRGYQPIYNNTKYGFGSAIAGPLGRLMQHVTITASDGKRYEAVYAMERQTDNQWKIAGVQMVEIPGVDA